MFNFILTFFDIAVPVLVNVAFVTLFERKILGLSQYRKGPNKVGTTGLLQPFADAVKLFNKEYSYIYTSNMYPFLIAPLLSLIFALVLWSMHPILGCMNWDYSGIVIFMVMSLGVYPLFGAGWASNSSYASFGALRGIAQTISYEISLALLLFCFLMLSMNLELFNESMVKNYSFLLILPLSLVWLVTCVAETNRTPFDFAEGESELVSGFNVEYGGGGFAVIFMAEYGFILFFSAFSIYLMTNFSLGSGWLESLSLSLAFLWMWLRTTYPRYRYDKLLNLAWKSLLPLTLFFAVYFGGVVSVSVI